MKKLERPSKVTAKTKSLPEPKSSGKPAKASEKPAQRTVEQLGKDSSVKPQPAKLQASAASATQPARKPSAPVAAAKPADDKPTAAKPAGASAVLPQAAKMETKSAEAVPPKLTEPKPADVRPTEPKPAEARPPVLSSISAIKPLPVPRLASATAEPSRPRSLQSNAKPVPRISRFRELTFKPRFAYGDMGKIAEVVGNDHGTELGFGFVRLTKARIPWTIKYDEVLFVIVGTLRVRTGGRTLELGPHDSIFLPAGTELVYEADDALITYAIQPASAARVPTT